MLRKIALVVATLTFGAGQAICPCAAASPAEPDSIIATDSTHPAHGFHSGHPTAHIGTVHGQGDNIPSQDHTDCSHCTQVAVAKSPLGDGQLGDASGVAERFILRPATNLPLFLVSAAIFARHRLPWALPPPPSPVSLKVRLQN
jgi:hypothetical protein